jgi:uncharacterized protein with HEPN domain
MYDVGDLARIEFALQMINNIDAIVERHGSVNKALKDLEGQSAILLCLLQLGEKLGKINDPILREKLPIKAAQSVRNIIVHDYTNVNISLIEELVQLNLPELKAKLREILGNEDSRKAL